MSTVVLDYGMGNLRSVAKACEFLGHPVRVQGSLSGAEKVILPGVGAFGMAMEHIGPGLAEEIGVFARSGQPLLGICLGQQLLFETSEEFGETRGLGILGGRVVYFPEGSGLKRPQIGWNVLDVAQRGGLLASVEEGDRVYFVHSLYTECAEAGDVAAWTEYGVRYASAVQRGNVWGAQFHPEKSGSVGLGILRSFLEWN